MTEMQHHYADLEDVRIHYVTAGSGEPLVLIHGWPQTWYEWRLIIPRLAEKYQVIAPDMRGLGDSSRPNEGYDKRTVANDIWRLSRDVLGFETWNLAGHDWGAAVAYALAADHPDAIRRLAIIDMVIPGAHGPLTWEQGNWHLGLHAVPDLPEELVQGREDIYLSWFYRNYAHKPDAISEEDLREYVRTYKQPGALRAGFDLYRAAEQDAATNAARLGGPKLTMPVLAVQGAGPFYGICVSHKRGANAVADSMRQLATDVQEALIEESGHWIAEEQPDALAEHLEAFFG